MVPAGTVCASQLNCDDQSCLRPDSSCGHSAKTQDDVVRTLVCQLHGGWSLFYPEYMLKGR
jgi:hypothetical protein